MISLKSFKIKLTEKNFQDDDNIYQKNSSKSFKIKLTGKKFHIGKNYLKNS